MRKGKYMNLDKLRDEVDAIDMNIIKLLEKRLSLAAKIGIIKKKHNLSIMDKKREQNIQFKLKNTAQRLNLDNEFVKQIYTIIISESKKIQRKI